MLATAAVKFQPAVSAPTPARIGQQDGRALPAPEPAPGVVVSIGAEAARLSAAAGAALHYGYSADATYFGSPAEFFASQKAHYQQLGYVVTEEWMASFTQAIMHPDAGGGVIAAPPLRSGEGSIKLADVLTDADQTIIRRISPSQDGGAGPRQINGLATIIALERSHGNLQGEIDANYANSLKQRLLAGKSEAVPLDMLDKLIVAVSQTSPGG